MFGKYCLKESLEYFSIAFLIFLCVHVFIGHTESDYVYDTKVYYEIGKSLFSSGNLSLDTISTDFRGFYFPLILGICNEINTMFDINWSFYVISSLFFSFFITIYSIFMMELFDELFYRNNSIIARIGMFLPIVLLVTFYWGNVVYPASDLYAALLILASGFLVYKVMDDKLEIASVVICSLAGVLAYCAYNIRTIYLLTLIAFVFCLAFQRKQNWRQGIKNAVAYCIGGELQQFRSLS